MVKVSESGGLRRVFLEGNESVHELDFGVRLGRENERVVTCDTRALDFTCDLFLICRSEKS